MDIGKVCSRPCEHFGVVGLSTALLGEPQSAVQDRTHGVAKMSSGSHTLRTLGFVTG